MKKKLKKGLIYALIGSMVIGNFTMFVNAEEGGEKAGISVSKVTDSTYYNEDDSITYTETVINTGNIDLTNIVVTEDLNGEFDDDDNLEVNGNKAVLDELTVGDEYTFVYTVKVSDVQVAEDYTVTSNVSVTANEGVSGEDSKTVTINHPDVSVIKTANKSQYYEDDTIIYTDIIQNKGNCKLTNIVVTEDLAGKFDEDGYIIVEDNVVTIPELEVGKFYKLTYRVIAGDVVNDIGQVASCVDVSTDESVGNEDISTVTVLSRNNDDDETSDENVSVDNQSIDSSDDSDDEESVSENTTVKMDDKDTDNDETVSSNSISVSSNTVSNNVISFSPQTGNDTGINWHTFLKIANYVAVVLCFCVMFMLGVDAKNKHAHKDE